MRADIVHMRADMGSHGANMGSQMGTVIGLESLAVTAQVLN